MRGCLFTTVVLIGFPLCAQTQPSEAQTLSTLLTEVQRLRLAIERNTLLGARTQISILQLQTQQTRTDKLTKDLDEVRKEVTRIEGERTGLSMALKETVSRLADAATPSNERGELERRLKTLKSAIEQPPARESQARAREAEIAGQLQSEQNRLAQLQNQIAEMERALDVAIKQITGQ